MDHGLDFSYFSSAPTPYMFEVNSSQQTSIGQTLDGSTPSQPHNGHYDPAFTAFQQNFQYDPTQFMAQPHIHNALSRASSLPYPLTSMSSAHGQSSLDSDHQTVADFSSLLDLQQIQHSSSEERETATPRQNKRKAQNRAAQRAFRERKEKHVKDLEVHNTNLQHEVVKQQTENERLRREITRFATENEILRATSGASVNGPAPFMTELDELICPQQFTHPTFKTGDTKTDKWAQFGTIETMTIDDANGEPLLGSIAAWNYIQASELFKQGLVEIGDVCERIKKSARCDGKAPVFQESEVRKAIMESASAGGRDELI